MKKTYIELIKRQIKSSISNKIKKILTYKYYKNGTKSFEVQTDQLNYQDISDVINKNWRV